MSAINKLDPEMTYEFPVPVAPGQPPRTAVARYLTARQSFQYARDFNAARQRALLDPEQFDAYVKVAARPIVSIDGSSEFDLAEMCTDTGIVALVTIMRDHAGMQEIEKKKSAWLSLSDAESGGSADDAPATNV